MIERIKKSLNEGVKVIKWIAAFLAERTKAETSIAKLLYKSNKLERRMDELYIDIGKRTLELREKGEVSVFKDFIIQQTAAEIKGLKETAEEYKSKARDLSKLPE